METSVVPLIKNQLKLDRFIIPYRIYGQGAENLVCINGIQQSMAMWFSFVRRFSRDYRITLFDFPNQGKGRILDGPAYVNLEEQLKILEAVINESGRDHDLTICSASWGGVIAAAFAVKHPEKMKRLILASMGTRPNQKMIDTIRKSAEIPTENRQEMAETLLESFGQDLPLVIKNKIISQFQKMTPETIKAFSQHGLFVISTREISSVVDLHRITCPTTLLNGENDTIIDLEDVTFLAEQIPDAEIKIIEGVGHFLHLEKKELLDVYADILKSCQKR
ncbi:alpha/beta fold hydrolase [Candidatus Omnitrophota bacterium]